MENSPRGLKRRETRRSRRSAPAACGGAPGSGGTVLRARREQARERCEWKGARGAFHRAERGRGGALRRWGRRTPAGGHECPVGLGAAVAGGEGARRRVGAGAH
jgi:hypothetical protein